MRKKPGIVLVAMAAQTGVSLLLIGAASFFLFSIYVVRNSTGSGQGLKPSLIAILPLAIAALAASWGGDGGPDSGQLRRTVHDDPRSVDRGGNASRRD